MGSSETKTQTFKKDNPTLSNFIKTDEVIMQFYNLMHAWEYCEPQNCHGKQGRFYSEKLNNIVIDARSLLG
jgi:hypothetical protein